MSKHDRVKQERASEPSRRSGRAGPRAVEATAAVWSGGAAGWPSSRPW